MFSNKSLIRHTVLCVCFPMCICVDGCGVGLHIHMYVCVRFPMCVCLDGGGVELHIHMYACVCVEARSQQHVSFLNI